MEDINLILKEKRRDCVEAEKTKMDKKAELLVLERRMQMERVEKEMEQKLDNERNRGLAFHEKQHNDERLAAEMSRLKREDERDIKLREQLRDSSEELKTLESKLRSAYVRKQLTAQIAEKEAAMAVEKLEKVKIQEMIEAEKRCMEEQVSQSKNSMLEKKLKYREELLSQIKEGSKKDQDAQRDLKLEKVLLEQSMRMLREDEEKEKKLHLERVQRVKHEIEEFQRQKEERKQSEIAASKELDRIIGEYAQERENLEEKRKLFLKERQAAQNKIKDQLTTSHLSYIQSMREREDILAELAEEEIRQRDLIKDKDKAELAEKLKADFIKFSKEHMEQKEAAWRTSFQEQESYRNQVSEDLAKQDKLDESSAGNKESKSKELREALQHQMRGKHKRQVESWQRESALAKLKDAEEAERMKIVEEERLRMLQKHASNLVGYLPRGVLNEHDLDKLGADFLQKLCKHKAMNSL